MPILLVFVAAALADCPSTNGDVDRGLEAAEASYVAMDLEGFRAAVGAVMEDAACLDERLSRATIARIHRFVGLDAFFVQHDADRAAAAFASARAISPEYRFPETLVPSGHPALDAYGARDPRTSAEEPLPEPAAGHIEVDDREATVRPADRPSFVQVIHDDGSVAFSAYSWAHEPLSYAVAPPPVAPPERHRLLPAVSAVSLAAAGVTYLVAYGVHDAYYNPATPEERLPSLRTANNALFATSVGLGVIGLGTGVGAVVAGRW